MDKVLTSYIFYYTFIIYCSLLHLIGTLDRTIVVKMLWSQREQKVSLQTYTYCGGSKRKVHILNIYDI